MIHNRGHPLGKEAGVTAEFIDAKALDPITVVLGQDDMGADELRNHAATVDVAKEYNGDASSLGKAHVRDIAVPQVHLGGGSSAFDDNQVMRLRQTVKAVEDRHHERRFHLAVVACFESGQPFALHDHLCAHIRFGFEQDRVHVRMRRQPTGQRLKRLCATNLSAVRGDSSVVRHVLRFERRDREATFAKGAT